MKKFTKTATCTSHIHCRTCRNDERWRQSIKEHFDWDGECPHGYTADNHPDPPAQTQPRPLPPRKEQVRNFVGAVARAAKKLTQDGKVLACEQERDRRIAICIDCAQWRNGRCAKCGCYLKAKVALETESCPMDKW